MEPTLRQEGPVDASEWVRRVLEGDLEAFRPLVQAYQDRLYSMALRFLRSAEDAEDMVQETFVRAYKNLAQFRQNQRFSAWIFTICANLCKSTLRRRKIVSFFSMEAAVTPSDESLKPQWASPEAGPEANLAQQRNLERLHKELLKLPDKLRLPLVLRTFDDMNDQEISRILGLSLSNVRVRIHRAKALLWERYQPVAEPNTTWSRLTKMAKKRNSEC